MLFKANSARYNGRRHKKERSMSDGQFSARPIRGERGREVTRTSGEFAKELPLPQGETTSFLDSRAVRDEVDALKDQLRREIATLECAPVDASAPPGAHDLGRPLASAVLVQDVLIGMILLRVCGWIILAFGGLILIGTLATLIGGRLRDPDAVVGLLVVGAFGLLIAAVGAWFGIFRGRAVNEMCWICSRGMIWRFQQYSSAIVRVTGQDFDWYAWNEVRDLYCDLRRERPALGISFGRNVSWISFRRSQAALAMLESVEKHASAAGLNDALRDFAEGSSLRFGPYHVSLSGIRAEREEFKWRDVLEASVDGRILLVRYVGGKLAISLDEVPFPTMLKTLVLAAHTYSREQR
jgi:hypothetical protein